MQRTKSKILSILLSLVMLLSLLPTTALAAGTYPAASEVCVDGSKYFGDPSNYYFKNNASGCSNDPTGYNAYYNPTTGTLTLDGYNGGSITVGGTRSKITVVLKGTNTITNGSLTSAWGGDITVTSSSGGTLSITNTLNDSNAAIGIETGYGPQTTGNVTITGNAQVKIDMTHNGTRGYEKAYGIFARENITISGDASVDIICKTQYNTARFGDYCNGLRTDKNVTIDTNGTIKIDVKTAGGDGAYSYGIYPVGGPATLTNVGKMEVQWKKDGSSGGVGYKGVSYDTSTYAVNVDEDNCTATYMPKVAATITSVSATVNQPVKGQPLDTVVSVPSAAKYTAEVMWKADGVTVTGNAQADTVYTAFITLKAKEGETFATTLNNIQTSSGYTIQMLNSTTLQLTKEFDSTGSKTMTGINIIDKIDGHALTVDVPHAAPNTTETNTLTLVAMGVYDDHSTAPVNVTWSIVTKPEGVDIGADGKLTVTNKAEGGTIQVKAELNGKTDTEQVAITKDGPVATAIVATAPATGTNITIPNGGTNTSGNCSYKVYDQYGAEMTGSHATWKMDPETVAGVTHSSDNGSISVNNTARTGTVKLYAESGALKSNEIIFNIAREASVAKSLTIEGTADSVNVPTVTEPGTTKCAYASYTAKVKDQYGAEMPGQTIAWSVTDNPGVTINNGQLTVTNKATAGNVTITATSGTLTATKTVTINKDTAKETFVKITAQGGATPVTTIICTGSQRLVPYTATVYDQYGNEKQDDVTWSLDPTTYTGVDYEISATNDNIVTLKVAPNAEVGTFKLVATSQTVTTVKGELEIKVQKKTDVNGKINFNDGSLTYNGAGQKYEKAALDSSVTAGTGEKWTYTYAVKSGATGALDAAGLPKIVGTYTVTATYEDSSNIGSKSATLTITPRKVDIPAGDTATYTYDGTEKTYNIPTSTDYTVSGNKQTNANEAGHIVTVTLKDIINTTWSDGTTGVKTYHFYIYKATPTGEPAYTKITTSGKTLADANLTKGTITPDGTIKWNDAKTTVVEANKSYGWTFTPTDTANYKPLTGTIKLWSKSTSSGGYYYAPTAAVVPDMPMLYRGCTGDAVKTLQDKLNALGYNSGNVDGIFGAKTYAAVTAFQKANSLGVDGIVGKLTWGKLYGVSPAMPVETTTVVGRPTVSYGSRGDAVRKLQELLNALGYDCGSVDGIFGSKTKAAVLAFQKANGLGVDGIVGPLTWAKLG